MASNSKLFTVFAIGLALHQKGLSWKSKVKDVIPDFQCMDKEADERTSFEELFSHTTGMPRHDISYE
jgi:CubicO group peptidase (beta-lactamase class C family)